MEVAGIRPLEQQFRAHIMNHKKKAENTLGMAQIF